MIQLADVVGALHSHWVRLGPRGVPTQFPGMRLDVTDHTEWLELWLTQIDETSSRQSAGQRMQLLVDVHCFSRHPHKLREIQRLVDTARQVLSRSSIPFDSSVEPGVCGLLRFRDPVVRDLSRVTDKQDKDPVQHWLISIRATAEQGSGGGRV